MVKKVKYTKEFMYLRYKIFKIHKPAFLKVCFKDVSKKQNRYTHVIFMKRLWVTISVTSKILCIG